MSDKSAKRRIYDIKECAKKLYADMGYRIINSDNEIFCFSAKDLAGTHERNVRVTADKISDKDRALILEIRVPPNQTKEIICRIYNKRGWIKLIYDHLNNLCQ